MSLPVGLCHVCVEHTTYGYDQVFTYAVPTVWAEQAQPGCRVLVPFGRHNGHRLGMILEVSQAEERPKGAKDILSVVDAVPLLNQEGRELVFYLKERYFCTLFEAVHLLLPTGLTMQVEECYALSPSVPEDAVPLLAIEREVIGYLRHRDKPVGAKKLMRDLQLPSVAVLRELYQKGYLERRTETLRRVGDATAQMVRLAEKPQAKLTPRQQEVVQVLQDVGEVSLKELCYFTGVTTSVVQALVKKGVVELFAKEIYRTEKKETAEMAPDPITLSPPQQKAYETLRELLIDTAPHVALLYGVTGSGKTLVFQRLIEATLQQGKSVILMVPEIALTPQTIGRFRRVYGKQVAVFHSGLSLGERLDEWKRVKAGQVQLVIGTRSAVFAPFENLGLLILDEEHEHTYKSEMSPRYHAREVAKFRCAYHKALLVLASATPSMESAYFAKQGRYQLVSLPARYGGAKLPEVLVADRNEDVLSGNRSAISMPLLEALKETLEKKEQAILLLNRRGYHTIATCKECKQVVTCPHCSISLTYHSANHRLLCHYCGYSTPFSEECPHCHSHSVQFMGIGTQRAEEELAALLPEAKLLRMDADTAMHKGAYEAKLTAFGKGEYDILLGTQMVAKGLDFPNVTLVGVLAADQSLYHDDYRSSERTFALLTQVIGRAGRGSKPGRAMIQTYTPDNPILALAATQDYAGFYQQEILFRKSMLYPPFVDLIAIRFVGTKEEAVRKAGERFLQRFAHLARTEYADLPLRMLPLSPALVTKVANQYRYRMLLKCKNTKPLRQLLSRLLIEASKDKAFAEVHVSIDTTPENF